MTSTFQSRAFDNLDGSYKALDEADRHPSTTRKEMKWLSHVFDGPIIEESRRKKLGREDAPQESIFGEDKAEYSSSN